MGHQVTERKTVMISARVPASLVARTDFVVRNIDVGADSRSEAVQAALEAWLPPLEQQLEKLGVLTKKAR